MDVTVYINSISLKLLRLHDYVALVMWVSGFGASTSHSGTGSPITWITYLLH